MTPRTVDQIVSDRVAEMTPEERDDYDTELAETRLALALADTLSSLRDRTRPTRRFTIRRWLGPRRRRIAHIESRKHELSLIQFTRAAHALGHCVTIKVAPEHDAASERAEPDLADTGFGFISSSGRLERL